MTLHFGKGAILAGCLAAIGCSAGIPALTGPAGQDHKYQVQAVGELPDVASVLPQLPARIAKADADRLLVSVDRSQVRLDGDYTLLATGRASAHTSSRSHGTMTTSSRNQNTMTTRSHVRDRFFDRFFTNDIFLTRSSIGFLPFRSFLFPYYSYGSYYYPYAYNCTVPFLVRSSAFLWPGTVAALNTQTGAVNPCIYPYSYYAPPGPALIQTFR
jgi:hypothetical protein